MPRDFKDVVIEELADSEAALLQDVQVWRAWALLAIGEVARLRAQLATARGELTRRQTVQAKTIDMGQRHRPTGVSPASPSAHTVQ